MQDIIRVLNANADKAKRLVQRLALGAAILRGARDEQCEIEQLSGLRVLHLAGKHAAALRQHVAQRAGQLGGILRHEPFPIGRRRRYSG